VNEVWSIKRPRRGSNAAPLGFRIVLKQAMIVLTDRLEKSFNILHLLTYCIYLMVIY